MHNLPATTPTNILACDPAFSALRPDEKANVYKRQEAMEYIDRARSKSKACLELASRYGHIAGWSQVRLRTLYYEWKNSGRSWRELANFSKRARSTSLARRFAEHYKRYCENNQRASKPAYRQMMLAFKSGARFEGIGTWQDVWCEETGIHHAPEFYPQGWTPNGMTYRNMNHFAELTAREKAATRIGPRAAQAFVPPVWTTRVGLLPGQVILADDVHHDAKVNVPGRNDRAMRPLEFAVLDVASAARVASGMKPELIREDGTVERLSARREFKAVVAQVLLDCGFRDDDQGTTLIGEHGTATLNQADREELLRITGGRFHFDAGGVDKAAVHKGMFAPEGRGNFRIKGLLEGGGGHLLAHNALAFLPGQVGSNSRTCGVEELAAREKYNTSLIKAIARFPEHKQKLFFSPFCPWVIYREVVASIYDELDRRRDHDMEGWEENGWVAIEWRASEASPWMPWEAIDDMRPEQAELCRKLANLPGNMRTVRMSPREVWNRHKHELRRLPMWALVDFLGADFRRTVPVNKRGEFEFEDAELGPGKHDYMSVIEQPDGSAARLQPGRNYALTILPANPSKAVVTEPETGVVLGVSLRVTKANRLNKRLLELGQEMQEVHVAAMNAPIQERHALDAAALQGGIAANEALLADLARSEDAEIVTGAASDGTGGGLDEALAAMAGRSNKGKGNGGSNEW